MLRGSAVKVAGCIFKLEGCAINVGGCVYSATLKKIRLFKKYLKI
jgi:uncharacterized protein YraI